MQIGDGLEEPLLGRAAEFLNGFLPAGSEPLWSADYFRWKLGEGNPAGRGFLTCAVSGGRVVGVVSAVRKRLWAGGRLLAGAEVGDTYTHPDFTRRRPPPGEPADFLKQSIFGRLATETRLRAMGQGVRLLYGTPNANARPGWEKRLGYRSHPTCDNRSFIRPTAQGLAARGAGFRLCRPLLAAGEWLFARSTEGICRLLGAGGGYSVEPMEKAAEGLDELWERLKDQHPFALVRDRAYFQHRFFGHPSANYRLFQVKHRRRIEGVLAARVMAAPWGKRYGWIADWILDESQPALFPILAAEAIRRMSVSGTDGFYLWCGSNRRLRRALAHLGFFRGAESPIIFYQNEEGKAIVEGCRDMDFTLASSDNI